MPVDVPCDGPQAESLKQVGVAFQDVDYSVQMGKGDGLAKAKPILRKVSGTVLSGEMLAIVGPSGGGKTSLISIIAGRLRSGGVRTVSGSVRCNGQQLTRAEFNCMSGLVTQEDVLNAVLTVRETLQFMARLRLSSEQRTGRVEKVLKMLQLEKCADTQVGDEKVPGQKGISGGEKRRLAIACEILDPNISLLVLDEPTSGLDAASALRVAHILRGLSQGGMTIIASVHQPRPSIVAQFHKLMAMADGQCVFFGPTSTFLPYFENTLGMDVPAHENPTDWLLDLLNPAIGLGVTAEDSSNQGESQQERGKMVDSLVRRYSESALCKDMQAEASKLPDGKALMDHISTRLGARVNFCGQFIVLLHRTFLVKLREPVATVTQLSMAIIMGLLFGGIYFDVYDRADSLTLSVLDAQMAISMTVVMIAFLPFDTLLTFPKERTIFLREMNANLYTTTSFYLARVIADMPMHALAGAIMSLISHPMIGLRCDIGDWIGLNVAGVLTGAAILQTVGAVCANFEQANILATLILMLFMMVSSSFLRTAPIWLGWCKGISFIGILVDCIIYLEFKDIGDYTPGVTAEDIFEAYDLPIRNEDEFYSNLVTIVILFIAARVLCFLAVKFLHTGKSLRELL